MLAVPPPPASGDDEVGEEGRFIDPLGPNAACYVCHLTFVHEELSVVHKAEKVTCIECHGLSAGHANDEDIGATPPDVVYKRERIDAACRECHEGHDVSAAAVLARFFERKLKPEPAAVCTDCHGQHRLKLRTVWWDKKTRKLIIREKGERTEPADDLTKEPKTDPKKQ